MAHTKLTWVYNRCEVNAVQAAMAYAKLHNRLGCCVATSGPGAGHLLSGLVDADQDRVPLLCITGLKAAGTMRHADFQDIDQGAIFRMAGIGLSESVSHIHQLIPLLRNALYLATTTYRCAHLAIPIDVQLDSVTAPRFLNFRSENLSKNVLDHASDEQIRALATALIKERMDGHHMVIFCGWRAFPFGDAIEALAEYLDVPIITSYDGKGCVSESIPHSFGVAGIYGFVGGGKSQEVLEDCDVIVAFCMSDLTKAVTDKSGMQTKYCHPGLFFKNMSLLLDNDAILCADIGDNALWMASGISAVKGQRTLTSEHMGIMGFALNAGLAASCSTSRQVLVVAGDGGFQMSSNELATLKDHGCKNVLVVIIQNGRLGRVSNETWGPGVRGDGCLIGSPDFVKLFEAHGYPKGKHLTTSDESEIWDTISESWDLASKQGVAVIVVHQDPETHPTMHKISAASGEVAWERYLNEMNKERSLKDNHDVSPSNKAITLSSNSINKLNSLKEWIESHSTAVVSSYCWVGSSFLSISPAQVFQNQLKELNPAAPEIFSQEERDDFDKDFWRLLMNSFTVEELSELFDKGSSNGYPLRLQILVLPKDSTYALHAHPNIELIIGMQGELMEYKLTDYRHSKRVLQRTSHKIIPPSDEEIKNMMEHFEHCMVIDDQDKRSHFVDRLCTRQGKCCANQIGSVHQSFSRKESGTLLFVLWSGCHANIQLTNIKGTKGAELLRKEHYC
eukprot:CCRYP_005593-RB/>CCRYP_005593-RB protein AED:0.11 eAED:0.11 QI:338/0.9/0.81/1/0.8/0.72/11/374/733